MVGGGGIDFGQLQKQVREMQKKMAELERELQDRVVEAASGGGMVKAKVNGVQEIVALEIDPQVLGDREILQDLVISAANEGLKKAKALRDKETAKIAGMGAGNLGGLLGM
jgi:hypothetical protein